MIRVLIADDLTFFRSGLKHLIDAEPDLEVVGEAADGQQTVAVVGQTQPDVVVLDLRMPQFDGLAAIAPIRESHPGVKIVGFSMVDPELARQTMLDAGADAFVSKDEGVDALIETIRSV